RTAKDRMAKVMRFFWGGHSAKVGFRLIGWWNAHSKKSAKSPLTANSPFPIFCVVFGPLIETFGSPLRLFGNGK
ncbi:MAG TPA: hypothetical protein PKA58_33015, partial [Polyangium sp.]|nr:hypothetical protein [Polyangium sp.]